MNKPPKILGRADKPIPPTEAMKFLQSIQMWDYLTQPEKDAFCMRGEILETKGGKALALKIAELGADSFLLSKYEKK